MPECLIVQPIHPTGEEALEAAGIRVRRASAQDMKTVAAEIETADALITRDAGLNAEAMNSAKNLKIIANHGIGTNKIDVAHAAELGIPISFTPTANARSVAEHAMMLILACAKRTVEADRAARNGNFRFKFEGGMSELTGKTLGIAGFGTIGRLLGEIAKNGFAMKVLVWSPSVDDDAIRDNGFEPVATLDALLEGSDVISLHRPARPDTHHMINAGTLRKMRPHAILVNTARGALIDEAALAEALESGVIRAAGLDVFDPEPLDESSPLTGLRNIVLAPHVAGSTEDALKATALACAQHIVDALADKRPESLVDAAVWEKRRNT